MKVYISVDVEGIAGIAHSFQLARGNQEFAIARRLMTAEANAAVTGAFEGGATAVLVNDAHGDMCNLLAEELDTRAELLVGRPKFPHLMVQGMSAELGVAFFIGYHARAGTEAATLDHTFSSACFYDVRLNGVSVSEAEINSLLLAHYGVPVGLVSGDDKTCAMAEARFPGVRTVAVKQAIGRQVVVTIHPEKAREAIQAAARGAVERADSLRIVALPDAFVLEADFTSTALTDAAAVVPMTLRTAARTLRYEGKDIEETFRYLVTWNQVAAATLLMDMTLSR